MTRSALAIAALVLALGAALAGGPLDTPAYIGAQALARRIISGAPVRVYDLRERAAFDRLHVAGAEHAAPGDVGVDTSSPFVVLYGTDAPLVWQRLVDGGQDSAFVLRGGMQSWLAEVLEPRLAVDATAEETAAFEEAAELSRFFGGLPRTGVPRAELVQDEAALTDAVIRRGCE